MPTSGARITVQAGFEGRLFHRVSRSPNSALARTDIQRCRARRSADCSGLGQEVFPKDMDDIRSCLDIHMNFGQYALWDRDCKAFRCELWMTGERAVTRSEEHTSELQSLMRISYAVF